jgi:alginate O-acetyltransferase complex protein AlgJ
MVPVFQRTRSQVMVRKIANPTHANLDYAAYTANPVRFDPEKFKPRAPAKKPGIGDMTFRGVLSGAVNSLAQTPLTAHEKDAPLAWAPLQKLLWSECKIDAFGALGSAINGYKWDDESIFKPYQEIAAVYVHETDNGPEMWVKVEFSPWVNFLKDITDEDSDGFPEIYGLLNTAAIAQDIKEKTFSWIRSTYQVKVLTEEQVVDWITVLASYWYPSLNTDMVDMTGRTRWPTDETETGMRKKLKGFTVEKPVAVVRGNPFGEPIYNVYVIPGMGGKGKTVKKAAAVVDKKIDTTISRNVEENTARFEKERTKHGGTYENWAAENAAFISAAKKILASIPSKQMAIPGKADWIFFRKSLEYTTAGDLARQADNKNPLPHCTVLKQLLDAKDINLIFVPVPTKVDVYYEKLKITCKDTISAIINPFGRKILDDLQKAGIEVIDLLPHFLKAKANDANADEPLYQRQDTHWTSRGLQIAASVIAGRIRQYTWYADTGLEKVTYALFDTTFLRVGDIVDKLPEKDVMKYPAVTLKAQQVIAPDGSKYSGNNPQAPILLMGDSFTGVFELVDCKSAGVGAHIAAKTGLPVDIITSWGGGPLVRNKMLRARKDTLGRKRVVIYMMTVRDLYNYSQGWESLKAE